MQLSKFDIGAEIISILTKGIYPDPRDAVREYIQNAVDATAKNVEVNVGQDYISITDDGFGMESETMRGAIRLGVSDKKPGKDVGFMGIGIYSSFHLCNTLDIYSKTETNDPARLTIDFEKMRSTLEQQRLERSQGVNSNELMGLQSLLESCIQLTGISQEEYPKVGTTVELTGLNPIILDSLSDFEQLAKYLQDAVPLHFDPEFKYGEEIEKKISDTCKEHGERFEAINLTLDVSSQKKSLFRPYTDPIFSNDTGQKPHYEVIKHNEVFIGIAWGVLNSARKIISDKALRGFLLKKQGFAIGNREKLSKYFTKTAHFNRYTGEIIIIHPELLPNASRDGLYPSKLQKQFEIEMGKIAGIYTEYSSDFQEYDKSRQILEESAMILREILVTKFEYSEDIDALINHTTKLSPIIHVVDRITKKNFNTENATERDKYSEQKKVAKDLLKSIIETIDNIAKRFKTLAESKQEEETKKKGNIGNKKFESAERISGIPDSEPQAEYEDLMDVLKDLDVEIPQIAIDILSMIDEEFLVEMSKTKADYQNILQDLKKKILLLIEGGDE